MCADWTEKRVLLLLSSVLRHCQAGLFVLVTMENSLRLDKMDLTSTWFNNFLAVEARVCLRLWNLMSDVLMDIVVFSLQDV